MKREKRQEVRPLSEEYIALIDEIAKCRKDKGFTQRELAKIANIAQSAVARIESKTSSPRLSTILKILVPLGKTLAVVPLESK